MLFPDNAKAIIASTFYDKDVDVMTKTSVVDAEGGYKKSISTKVSTFKANVCYTNYGEIKDDLGSILEVDLKITCPTETAVEVDNFLQYEAVNYVVTDVFKRDSHKLLYCKKWQG